MAVNFSLVDQPKNSINATCVCVDRAASAAFLVEASGLDAAQAEQIAARRGLFSWAGVHEVGGPGATRADAHPHHRHDLSVVSGVLFLTGSSSRQSQRRRKCSEECMYHPNPSTCQTKLQM
jgi:hypothetical protein